jgi:hypothetical protein
MDLKNNFMLLILSLKEIIQYVQLIGPTIFKRNNDV